MFEKVNPSHPDKVADRIAGAIVDYAYKIQESPKVAAEVLIGHGKCTVIVETSAPLEKPYIEGIIARISGVTNSDITIVPQDEHLAGNQEGTVRCGDNGIFKGAVVSPEEWELAQIAHYIYEDYPTDGKYIVNNKELTICQSCAETAALRRAFPYATINPLGAWTGGPDVDTGATNRKLGSDMARSATGGGLHGKDLSKADVSVNIYAWLLAQKLGKDVEFCCSIGDQHVGGVPYADIVRVARDYINDVGGFEKFAEWGLVTW